MTTWNPMAQQYEPKQQPLTDFLLARIAEDEAYEAGPHADHNEHTFRRAMAECEAKRRIVEVAISTGVNRRNAQSEHAASAMETTLKLLASVYADHADYRDEWRP